MQPDPFQQHFQQVCENLAMGLVGGRVRVRALLELLEEKGVLGPGQFDERAAHLWERDYEDLAGELAGLMPAPSGGPGPAEAAAPPAAIEAPAGPPSDPFGPQMAAAVERQYAEALASFVDAAVAARVRLRALLELLEESGLIAPGEFDSKAEAIWERDYEELVLDYYQGRY